jgi:hypothetical protein
VVGQRWWRRRRPAQAASTAVEEIGTSGVDSGGGDWRSRERESGSDLESFGMKSEMTRGMLIFIGLKISEAVLK